jgi:hypothetical protein
MRKIMIGIFLLSSLGSVLYSQETNEKEGMKVLEQIRKESGSKTVKVVVPSPQSKFGVEKILKETNGLLQTELDVEYYSDDLDSEGKERKNVGKIRDNQMTQAMEVELPDELRDSTKNIYKYCKEIDSLNVKTSNIVDYEKYLARRKR